NDASRTPTRRRPLTLYEPPAPPSTGFGADQWAMTIDLDLCTGCSACVVACQAENNVPVDGRTGVLESREMHWLRIDRYVASEPGVMEKCTFCVQRIRRAQMDAELAGETCTGPVVTACQQACPTHAIIFGSLTDPTSEVAHLSHDERAFSVLAELGTVPRVRYL